MEARVQLWVSSSIYQFPFIFETESHDLALAVFETCYVDQVGLELMDLQVTCLFPSPECCD